MNYIDSSAQIVFISLPPLGRKTKLTLVQETRKTAAEHFL